MDMAGWRAYQNSKWAAIQGSLPEGHGLRLSWSQHGPGGDTFIMGIDHDAFGEQRVIVGRPAQVVARTFVGQAGYVDENIIDGGENVPLTTMREILADWTAGKAWKPRLVRR